MRPVLFYIFDIKQTNINMRKPILVVLTIIFSAVTLHAQQPKKPNASQIYEPDSLGSVRLVNRLGLGWAHAFTEKLQGLLTGDYIRDDFRDYYTIQPGLSYRMTEHLSLAGNYRYRREERTASNAESNALFISLSYNN